MVSSQAVWKRALWAVDPFARHAEHQRSALQIFYLLAGKESVVEPVYLLSGCPTAEGILSEIEGMAVKKYHNLVEPTRYPGLLPLKIIESPQSMRRSEVQALLDYAEESGADLLIVSTRANSGPRRWLVGSFTDTLTLLSDIPLLVVNPTCRPEDGIAEIVFPTDFSLESQKAYERACKLAKDMEQPITIFHKIPSTNVSLYYTDLVASPMYQITYREQAEYADTQSKIWVELAKSRGVAAQVEILTACTQSAADAILDYTEKRKCLIAIAAKSGPVTSVLLGGTTRRVVRGAMVPVWVVHC